MTQQHHPDIDALLKLAERCEAAKGPDHNLSHDICRAMVGHSGYAYRPYTASLNAAMTLVPEGWCWTLSHLFLGKEATARLFRPETTDDPMATAISPALALCAASLRALAVSK